MNDGHRVLKLKEIRQNFDGIHLIKETGKFDVHVLITEIKGEHYEEDQITKRWMKP